MPAPKRGAKKDFSITAAAWLRASSHKEAGLKSQESWKGLENRLCPSKRLILGSQEGDDGQSGALRKAAAPVRPRSELVGLLA